MKSGYIPTRASHRDFDFFKSRGFGTTILPAEINNDAGLWTPNQNAPEPIFNNPPLPYGCTDYAQNDLAADHLGFLCNPAYTESKTHANALGGLDVRVSFSSIKNDGVQDQMGNIHFPFKQFFNVNAQGQFDWFDAFRACMAITKGRSISIGVPWMPEFQNTVTKNANGTYTVSALPADWDAVLPMIDPPKELMGGLFGTFHRAKQFFGRIVFGAESYGNYSWHNAKIGRATAYNNKGQLIRGGEILLAVKPWEDVNYGDRGWVYMSRALCNVIFGLRYTIALVGSPEALPVIQKVDLSWLQYLTSLVGYFAHMNVKILLSFLPKAWTI